MRFRFEKGKAYFANPTLPCAKQIVVACTSVSNGYATFCRVDMLKRVKVRPVDDRETVVIKSNSGLDYFVSAVCEADVANADKVHAAMGGV